MPVRYEPEKFFNFTPVLKPVPVPDCETLDDTPAMCVQIPVAMRPHLLGLLEIYRWRDKFIGTPAEIDRALMLFEDLRIRLMLGGCDDMPYALRQKPDDPCVLQQSLDGGITWTDAFDYLACWKAMNKKTLTLGDWLEGKKLYDEYYDDFERLRSDYDTGGREGIAPDTTYGDADDLYRDLALCYVCERFIALLCDTESKIRQEVHSEGFTWAATTVGLVLGAAILGVLAIPASAAAIMTVFATFSGAAAFVWDDLSNDVLEDEDARKEVACCMYNALSGSTPTETAVRNSLSNCGFDFGSNAAQLSGAISRVLDSDDGYIGFVKLMNEAIAKARVGVLPACACDPDTITVTFDEGGYENYSLGADNLGTVQTSGGNPVGVLRHNDYKDGLVSLDLVVSLPAGSTARTVSFDAILQYNASHQDGVIKIDWRDGSTVIEAQQMRIDVIENLDWHSYVFTRETFGAVTSVRIKLYLNVGGYPRPVDYRLDNISISK